jgi:hypothetical protein
VKNDLMKTQESFVAEGATHACCKDDSTSVLSRIDNRLSPGSTAAFLIGQSEKVGL